MNLNDPALRRRWEIEQKLIENDLVDERISRFHRFIWLGFVLFFALDIVVASWVILSRM